MVETIVYEISQSESLIMNFLWEEGAKSFVEIMAFLNGEKGKGWKKQTINTFIRRLCDKGLVTADETGRNRVYHAAITETEFEKGKAKRLLDEFYNGSVYSFLSALTGGQGVDKRFAEELRSMIEDGFTDRRE